MRKTSSLITFIYFLSNRMGVKTSRDRNVLPVCQISLSVSIVTNFRFVVSWFVDVTAWGCWMYFFVTPYKWVKCFTELNNLQKDYKFMKIVVFWWFISVSIDVIRIYRSGIYEAYIPTLVILVATNARCFLCGNGHIIIRYFIIPPRNSQVMYILLYLGM